MQLARRNPGREGEGQSTTEGEKSNGHPRRVEHQASNGQGTCMLSAAETLEQS